MGRDVNVRFMIGIRSFHKELFFFPLAMNDVTNQYEIFPVITCVFLPLSAEFSNCNNIDSRPKYNEFPFLEISFTLKFRRGGNLQVRTT